MKKWVYLLIGILVGGILFSVSMVQFRRLIDDKVYGNKDHYLSCEELPGQDVVVETLRKHQEVVDRLLLINPGAVLVYQDNWTCPGKADIVIEYPTVRDRVEIEGIIGGERFFGIPYRLRKTST